MALKKRSLKVIGIDIGSTMIKMVEVFISETPKITKWACIEIPPGNLEASPTQNKNIIKALKMCLGQLKPSTHIASICISDPDVIIKDMIIPSMGEKEILDNIRFELSEYFSTDLKEYKMSYRLFGSNYNAVKEQLTVLVAAAPVVLLYRYKDIVRRSGLKLKYIDVSANCISKLLVKMRNFDEPNGNSNSKQVLCIADLGTNIIDISIYEGENFKLNRTITVSDFNYDELVVYELSQVIDYYHRKNYEDRIEKIILAGGKSYNNGLAEQISNQLLLPAEIVCPDMFKAFEEIQEEFRMALYFKALGSALRED